VNREVGVEQEAKIADQREQTRRDAEALINVNPNDEIPTSGYDELRFAGACLALLAELEQAERERVEWEAATKEATSKMIDLISECESRLAKVPALVERTRSELTALERWAGEQNAGNAFAEQVRQWALSKLERLAVWEQSQGKP
jgi:hypothetical protein